MKYFTITFLLLCSIVSPAQTPKQILAQVNKKFNRVNDYTADIHLTFNLPSIKMQAIDGKVFFKKPSKYRVRTKGIVFLPKQNPYTSMAALNDTNSFDTFIAGEEKIGGKMTTIIKVSPNNENDLILGKFWIDRDNNIILRSQLTTRSAGTISIENTYGVNANVAYALPDRMTMTVDMSKFKVPKMVAADINTKSTGSAQTSQKGTGVIQLTYSHYSINQKVPDSVFTDQE
jgi:outer membrane lipoprotein-sorting protein